LPMPMTDSSLFLLQLRLLERPRRAAVETTAGRKRKWENGGLEHTFFIFPYIYIWDNIWVVILPIDEVHHFSEGWRKNTNQIYSSGRAAHLS